MPAAIPLKDHVLTASMSLIARSFGLTTQAVSKKLREANVEPAGMKSGYPVYYVRDAAAAILIGRAKTADGATDWRLLPASEMSAYVTANEKRLDYEERLGTLLRRAEAEAIFADLIGWFAKTLETFPDLAERSLQLTPEQVTAMQDMVTTQRQELYERMHNMKPVAQQDAKEA